MTSIIELELNISQEKLAALFTDPKFSLEWMDDVGKIEPLQGDLGKPGSTYRMIPKKGNFIFTARVGSQELPKQAKIELEASFVSVFITGKFIAMSANRSRLISEEIFVFKGFIGKMMGFFGAGSVKKAHRKHLESFKAVAERRGRENV